MKLIWLFDFDQIRTWDVGWTIGMRVFSVQNWVVSSIALFRRQLITAHKIQKIVQYNVLSVHMVS